jgi:hypothetical protein
VPEDLLSFTAASTFTKTKHPNKVKALMIQQPEIDRFSSILSNVSEIVKVL